MTGCHDVLFNIPQFLSLSLRNIRPSSLSRYIYLISGVVARGFVFFAPGAGVPLCLRMFA